MEGAAVLCVVHEEPDSLSSTSLWLSWHVWIKFLSRRLPFTLLDDTSIPVNQTWLNWVLIGPLLNLACGGVCNSGKRAYNWIQAPLYSCMHLHVKMYYYFMTAHSHNLEARLAIRTLKCTIQSGFNSSTDKFIHLSLSTLLGVQQLFRAPLSTVVPRASRSE